MVLEENNRPRLPDLVPVRYGRMVTSPFAFLRGSAVIMANDLALTPATALRVQACGDAHLGNFGVFGTPERNLVFDVNDFDETLPGPWEWDVKRLAVSVVLAARNLRVDEEQAATMAGAAVQAYRSRMGELAAMGPLDVWYDRIDVATVLAIAKQEHQAPVARRQAPSAHQPAGPAEAGRWHERTAGPATPRRSRDTWARDTSSTTRFPSSPPPTPIRSPAITRNWSRRHSPGA